MHCPRGDSVPLFSSQPSVSVGDTSQPPRGSPSQPIWMSDIQTQQVFSLLGCKWQGHQNGLPKTSVNCAHGRASHNSQKPPNMGIYTQPKEQNGSIFIIWPFRELSLPRCRQERVWILWTWPTAFKCTHLLSNCLSYHSPELAFSPFLLLKHHLSTYRDENQTLRLRCSRNLIY